MIYLVRHAQASFGEADYDRLSPLGERQSDHLGRVLRDRGVTPSLVVTGRQVRQQETARLALRASGAGVSVDTCVDEGYDEYDHEALLDVPELAERMAAVRSAEDPDRALLFQAALVEATRRWVNGEGAYAEPFGSFWTRVIAALARTADRVGSGEAAMVVTSGGPIAVVAAALSDASGSGWLRLNPALVNTGISKVVSGSRGLSLVSLNEHAHLEGVHADLFSYR